MAEFDYSIVQNPAFYAEGTLPPHSDHVPRAPADGFGKTSLRLSLDGMWKFRCSGNYISAPKGFEQPDFDVSGWEDISVPSNIQFEGYDAPAYVNTQYPWDGVEDIEPGRIPERFNPVGQYARTFTLPEDWKNDRVRISFQGVESGFACWLNGTYLGYAEDSFTPSEFDLTPFLKEGENRIAVLVFKWTSGSWCEDQDMYRLSGIFRDVYLERLPKAHLEDLKILSGLADGFRDGLLDVSLRLSGNLTEAAVDWNLEKIGVVKAFDDLKEDGDRTEAGSVSAESGEAAIHLCLKDVLAWSAELPNLYRLNLLVRSGEEEVEKVSELVGFRRFEMKDGIMCLNGKRIVFNGVNRHEFSCDTGRSPRLSDVLHDVKVMKQNNINAIRTCHYPDASILYQLCDIFGLYMIAENNMETHGMWDRVARGQMPLSDALPGDRKDWEPLLISRIDSMYELCKNHPAVLIWSCGNESFGGSVIFHIAEELRRLDRTRLVHYEGIQHDMRYPDTSDMYSQMYTPAAGVEKYLREHKDKPLILCEYAHSMGNSNGGMFKYTDLAKWEPRYQGGFIWDFIDQAVRMKNRFGEEFLGYGGDNYERPTDYEFSGNGILDACRRPYGGKMQEVKFLYQNFDVTVAEDGASFRLENRSLFETTGAFGCRAELKKEGKVLRSAYISTGVAAGETGEYGLPFTVPADGEYVISVSLFLKEDTIWGKAGHEIACGERIFRDPSCADKTLESLPEDWREDGNPLVLNGVSAAPAVKEKKMKVIKGAINIGVAGDHFSVLFSRLKGCMVSYRFHGRELIERFPRPNFWRAPTNNDEGNHMPQRYGVWKLASLYHDFAGPEDNIYDSGCEAAQYPKLEEKDGYADIIFKRYFTVDVQEKQASVLTTYRVFPDGTVRLILAFDGDGSLPPMPEFGWMFTLNGDFGHVRYYGLGPEENYCDRNRGSRLSVYERDVRDMAEPYLVPQETGNRTGVRYAEVTDHRGHGVRFTAAYFEDPEDPESSKPGSMEFSALPYSPEMLEEARHPYELPRSQFTYVRCSLKQMGIGGDDSWGARTHEEFLLKTCGRMTFAVDFKGI